MYVQELQDSDEHYRYVSPNLQVRPIYKLAQLKSSPTYMFPLLKSSPQRPRAQH